MNISGVFTQKDYVNRIPGKAINQAADDPSGLAIAEKMEAQETSLSVGSSNSETGRDLINVADGALSTIHDSLQRIRELSIQASSSAIYSPSDMTAMQKEIDGLKQSIQDTAKGTTFNTLKLLDGSMADLNLATNPQGGGVKIQLVNSTLESLGIEDYDITKDFSIKDIDNAIQKVSDARSSLGAQSNALEYISRSNDLTSQNTTAARSKIEDEDFIKQISEQKQKEVLDQYRIFATQGQLDTEAGMLKMFQ